MLLFDSLCSLIVDLVVVVIARVGIGRVGIVSGQGCMSLLEIEVVVFKIDVGTFDIRNTLIAETIGIVRMRLVWGRFDVGVKIRVLQRVIVVVLIRIESVVVVIGKARGVVCIIGARLRVCSPI